MAAAFEPDIGHLLQQLHDIHPAAEPSWWPPAPGWWLLAALLLALLAYGVHRWRVRQRRLAPLRAAERELSAALQAAERLPPDVAGRHYAHAANAVFRRVLGVLRPQVDAGLTGTAWQRTLTDIAGTGAPDLTVLAQLEQARFSSVSPTVDLHALHGPCVAWLRALRRQALHPERP